MTPTLRELVCPRCGCTDIRTYAEEQPICPHCGTVLDLTPPRAPTWLEQWPQARRSGLAQLFYTAVRSGLSDPCAIVGQVQTALQRRVQWTVSLDQRQWLCEVLATLEFHPQAARAYAATVVAREQLPPDAKAALKQAQAKPFLLEAMKGKPTTASQMWRLRHEGYTGPIPADRAAASELLATILQTKGGA